VARSAISKWMRDHDLLLQESLSLLPSMRRLRPLRARYYSGALRACGTDLEICQHVILKFPQRLSIGSNVTINRGTFITARAEITIGDNVLFGPYVVLNSGDHDHSDSATPMARQGHTLAPITIADDVWIGAHALILKGAVIGRGAIVAGGAVVTGEVEPYTIVAGVPARVIKTRAPLSHVAA
jgi:acetyltransferase-like isoleucine patch superfamily enzyme